MDTENRILRHDEIYARLIAALEEKRPLAPTGWSVSQLDEEAFKATGEYEPDAFLRQKDAFETSLFYLADFSARMPEWIDTTENNERVRKACEMLALEIENITNRPGDVISRDGKLKVRLAAILAVQTCLIYREETEKASAKSKEAKRASLLTTKENDPLFSSTAGHEKWRSALAKSIFERARAKTKVETPEQPSLF